jgi:hypothetical protein
MPMNYRKTGARQLPRRSGLRRIHLVLCAMFSGIGIASWQRLVWSRNSGNHGLVGLFGFACCICLIAAIQSIALPLVAKYSSARPSHRDVSNSEEQLSRKISVEAGELVKRLVRAGWNMTSSRYDKRFFGNWYVELVRADQVLTITKDRNQYLACGPSYAELQAAGLQRSFDDFEAFAALVYQWASRPVPHRLISE